MANFVATSSNFISYDSTLSALNCRWYNNLGVIDFAPIYPQFIGKTPKKGDKVYDYESKESLFINGQLATQLIKALETLKEALMSEDEVDFSTVSVEQGFGSKTTTFIFHYPGSMNRRLKVGGKPVDTSENIVMQVNITQDEDVTKIFHILQNSNIFISNEKVTVYTDLEMLIEYFKQVVQLSLGGLEHIGALANKRNNKTFTKKSTSTTFSAVDDEDDDDRFDDEDNGSFDEDDDLPKSKSKYNKSKNASKIASDIEDEFDE